MLHKKIKIYLNISNTNCLKSTNNIILMTTITNNENVNISEDKNMIAFCYV